MLLSTASTVQPEPEPEEIPVTVSSILPRKKPISSENFRILAPSDTKESEFIVLSILYIQRHANLNATATNKVL